MTKETGNNNFIVNETFLRYFVAYVWRNKNVKHGTVIGYLAAFRSFLISKGIPFERFDMPVLRQQLRGYAFKRGNKPDTRVSISVWNGKLPVLLNSIKPINYVNKLKRIVFLLQHKAILRTAETGLGKNNSESWDRVLRVSNFIWYPTFADAQDVVVCKLSSKTDRLGRRNQQIPVTCECPGPCLVHELQQWFILLANKNSGVLPHNSFVFKFENDRIVSAALIRKWLATQCDILGWNKKVHKPYSLRIGRAEDLFHIGLPAITIRDLGCWRSDCYMKYIRPTATDNLLILKGLRGKKRRCIIEQFYKHKNSLKFRDIDTK